MVTRRSLVAGMAGLPIVMSFLGQNFAHAEEAPLSDMIATSEGDLVIHPIDHASLALEWDDKVLYVDPVGGAERYAALPAPTAILITHGHGDHFDLPTLDAIAGAAPLLTNQDVYDKLPAALQARAIALANGETGEIDGVPVAAIAAHNTTEERLRYHPRGVGNGYVLSLGDRKVYIAGDTEPTPDMLALRDIAVAFLPMNLPYTMTPEQAVEAINIFKPGIVYPYHYGDSDLSALETGLAAGIELRRRNWYPNATS
ncbi:MAG: MBL fold metallo-hydrolase [Devosia sp.]|nr:MBL fold metallo-hydrolase [Devosia sp.]